MKEIITKLIILSILSLASGFLDAFLKDININLSYQILFFLGWISCLICNYKEND